MSSAETLMLLNQRTDFMDSLSVIADMGCGKGTNAAAWADSIDENGKSRNFFVFAVDKILRIDNHNRRQNLRFIKEDFSNTTIAKNKVDVLWCYDAFQYATDPVKTLHHWHDIMSENGLLYIAIPQSNYIDDLSRWQMINSSGCFWPHNIVSLIYLLAACGFDCRDGHFKQRRHENMIHLCAYKSQYKPLNLDKATLYLLDEMKLLPSSISKCIQKYGSIRHEFLKLEWIDKTVSDLAIESIP
jgi:SAM-dependent methyltransferase